MTTHFSNGVTNVRGKDGDTSLFSGIKQPLITGGYNQEQAYQNDWITFNDEDWDITTAGGSEFFLPEYAGGWLRIGDNAPAGGEVNGLSSKEVFQYNEGKQWWYETRIAVTDVSDYNIFVGFADNGFVDPATVPTDCIGFSHLEDTTTIQFLSRKNGAGVSFDMVDTAGGSTYTFQDSTVPTQTATTLAIPSNSVRLVEVAKKAGCNNSHLMHSEKEIPFNEIDNSEIIGISSGASAPEKLVQNLLDNLRKDRKVSIEEVIVAEEKVVFKLPKELN